MPPTWTPAQHRLWAALVLAAAMQASAPRPPAPATWQQGALL